MKIIQMKKKIHYIAQMENVGLNLECNITIPKTGQKIQFIVKFKYWNDIFLLNNTVNHFLYILMSLL